MKQGNIHRLAKSAIDNKPHLVMFNLVTGDMPEDVGKYEPVVSEDFDIEAKLIRYKEEFFLLEIREKIIAFMKKHAEELISEDMFVGALIQEDKKLILQLRKTK
jgi:hypothetical protein